MPLGGYRVMRNGLICLVTECRLDTLTDIWVVLLKVTSIVCLRLFWDITHSAALNKRASTVIKLTIRESFFRENDHPGKLTIRETTANPSNSN